MPDISIINNYLEIKDIGVMLLMMSLLKIIFWGGLVGMIYMSTGFMIGAFLGLLIGNRINIIINI